MATPIVSEEHCALLDAVQVYVDREWQRHGKFIANQVGFEAYISVDWILQHINFAFVCSVHSNRSLHTAA